MFFCLQLKPHWVNNIFIENFKKHLEKLKWHKKTGGKPGCLIK
jgi:hypothetical protein